MRLPVVVEAEVVVSVLEVVPVDVPEDVVASVVGEVVGVVVAVVGDEVVGAVVDSLQKRYFPNYSQNESISTVRDNY